MNKVVRDEINKLLNSITHLNTFISFLTTLFILIFKLKLKY
jgi:hypothetical protein